MIRVVEDNIINAKEPIIVQQVNCKGVMGAGVAKAIREKYPQVYIDYTDVCRGNESRGNDSNYLLGDFVSTLIEDKQKLIVSIFGQDSYGNDGRKYTNYLALFNGLLNVFTTSNSDVAMPYEIGCGLGGGEWKEVSNFLVLCAIDFPHDIVLYKYNPNK